MPDQTRAVQRLPLGPVSLSVDGLVILVEDADVAGDLRSVPRGLSSAALEAVLRRYGHPLEPGIEPDPGYLALPGGARLCHLAYRAPVDVIANDYVVLESEGQVLAAPQPLVVQVVRALSRPTDGEVP